MLNKNGWIYSNFVFASYDFCLLIFYLLIGSISSFPIPISCKAFYDRCISSPIMLHFSIICYRVNIGTWSPCSESTLFFTFNCTSPLTTFLKFTQFSFSYIRTMQDFSVFKQLLSSTVSFHVSVVLPDALPFFWRFNGVWNSSFLMFDLPFPIEVFVQVLY